MIFGQRREKGSSVSDILPWVQIATAIAAPLLIAGATLSASKRATLKAHELDRRRRNEMEQSQLEAVLWGIHVEIVELVDHYFRAIGNELEKDLHPNTLFAHYMVAEQPYFTVYENAADTLGHLDDSELMRSIVRTYTILKRVLDAHTVQRGIVQPEAEGWRRRAQAHKPQLVELHKELKRTSEHTIYLLTIRHGPLTPDRADYPPPGYMP